MRVKTAEFVAVLQAVLLISGCQAFAGGPGAKPKPAPLVARAEAEPAPAPKAVVAPAEEPAKEPVRPAPVEAPVEESPAPPVKKEATPTRVERVSAPTAVEQAILWSQRYADALDALAAKDEAMGNQREENRALAAKVTRLELKLEQAEKELSEANELLVEMQRSLDDWKKDVLGFREEMRQSAEAQMKALVKVLSLLGAEPTEEESDSEEEM